jgi:hypothetical protein
MVDDNFIRNERRANVAATRIWFIPLPLDFELSVWNEIGEFDFWNLSNGSK